MPIYREDLYNPLLEAIKRLGGSATTSELDEEVMKSLQLTEEEIAETHKARWTELEFQLPWARTNLKAYGLLDNSERGVWVLTLKGKDTDAVDPREVTRFVQSLRKNKKSRSIVEDSEGVEEAAEAILEQTALEETWREELLSILTELPPDAFERLCQRLLRESGFTEVKVTGRTGDGGIDGVGIVRLGGLLSFRVIFQCKRYRGSVGAGTMRDFRGAMIGRADRGLVLTTGSFSRDAKIEATRDGAPPIDLVDGEQLIDKLKELQLGVKVRTIEQPFILPEFFKEI
jgi:restriction system protein